MNEIVVYLIQTLLSLFLLAVLLRFLLQLVRADFYNPISQFLAKVTNPIILPLRKIIPSYASLDLSSLLVALLLQLAGIVTVLFLNGIAARHPAVTYLVCPRHYRPAGEHLFLRPAGNDYSQLGSAEQQKCGRFLAVPDH